MRPEYVADFRVLCPKRFLCIGGRGRYDIEQSYKVTDMNFGHNYIGLILKWRAMSEKMRHWIGGKILLEVSLQSGRMDQP